MSTGYRFKKGYIPWNKGKHFVSSGSFKKGEHHSITTEFKKGIHPLTEFKKGCVSLRKGKIGYWRNKKRPEHSLKVSGKNHYLWKGGISENKDYWNEKRKEKRHQLGINKLYREKYNGKSKTKEYKKLQRQKRKASFKGGGELSIKTIQRVYEDNIKKYGTLTCYLCLKPIEFRQDSLEHKTPLSRGGNNLYENLDIAHLSCNKKKHNKTEIEFMEVIQNVRQFIS